MKAEKIKQLFEQFEEACYLYQGLECWSARELQEVLGYAEWRNFTKVLEKAKEACENAGQSGSDHFVGVNKKVDKDLKGDRSIGKEHVDNNLAVRKILLERGVRPEDLPPAEDVKKVERRLASDEKKLLQETKKGKEKK